MFNQMLSHTAKVHDQWQRTEERQHHAQILWMAEASVERKAIAPWHCLAQPEVTDSLDTFPDLKKRLKSASKPSCQAKVSPMSPRT